MCLADYSTLGVSRLQTHIHNEERLAATSENHVLLGAISSTELSFRFQRSNVRKDADRLFDAVRLAVICAGLRVPSLSAITGRLLK
jgi:hypothetical protein